MTAMRIRSMIVRRDGTASFMAATEGYGVGPGRTDLADYAICSMTEEDAKGLERGDMVEVDRPRDRSPRVEQSFALDTEMRKALLETLEEAAL